MSPRLSPLFTCCAPLAVLCVAVACAPAPPAPELHTVSPGWGWTGEATDIAIVGKRLYPDVLVGDPGDAQFESSFRVFLQTDPPTELSAVQFVDTSTLAAEVPPGVAPGTYDLRVVTPAGAEATLDAAFRVTQTRADHLAFVVDRVGYDVTELASVGLRLSDPDGATVAQPMLVQLRAESADGATSLSFDADALDNQQALDDGSGVFGNLHPDGTATLLFRSAYAQDLTLTLTSVEDPAITAASTLLSFSPGVPDHIELTVPEAPVTAGESIDVGIVVRDAAGNAVDASGLRVLVYEECGAVRQSVDLLQAGPYPIQLTAACAGNRLHALGLGVEEAVSDAFDVLPGPIDGYAVRAAPSTVVAGSGVLAVQVDALDAYGNALPEHAATLWLTDSVGGLAPDRYRCDPFVGGQTVCVASPLRAGASVVVAATDELGRSGYAPPIAVVADAPVLASVSVGAPVVEAGDVFSVAVSVEDAWGNAVVYDPDAVVVEDDTGTLACTPTADGNFACSVTASDPGDVITVSVLDLVATSAPLVVTNAALARADVAVASTSVTAGQTLNATVRGYDTYGNAYTTAVSASAVSVSDTLGGAAPVTAALDGAGSATVTLVPTAAGQDVLVASAGGVELGRSTPVTVLAASAAGLEVDGPSWADVDAGVPLAVRLVDAYGNTVSDQDGTIDASLPGCSDASGDLRDGEASIDLACSAASLEAVATVTDGSFVAESAPIDVLDFACADGPIASLEIDGGDVAVACLVAGAATLTVDASGSVVGASTLTAWHLDDGASGDVRTTAAPSLIEYEVAGAHAVELVVADAAACGSTASAAAYVGNDDGSAVGPVTVTPSNGSVRSTGSTSVALAALDCTGDVAGGAEVYVWADLGAVAGTSTGAGTTVTLDAAGVGSTLWAFSTGYAGQATIQVSSADGAGFGSATVTVTDDSVRPTVVDVTPAGTTSGTVTDVVVTFSEPMLASSLTTTAVTLSGPSGSIPVTVSVSADGETLTVTPSSAVDASSGTYTVAVSAAARDSAGNRLSGDYSGNASAWSAVFGAVSSSVPAGSCTIGASAFRPDGDDGPDADADTIEVALSGTPTWWALAVTDVDGTAVRRTQLDGASTSLSWDGRGDDGRVVAEGTYTVRVSALDADSNSEDRCTADVALSQRGRAP